jgi:SAM-dependent methyltransferase
LTTAHDAPVRESDDMSTAEPPQDAFSLAEPEALPADLVRAWNALAEIDYRSLQNACTREPRRWGDAEWEQLLLSKRGMAALMCAQLGLQGPLLDIACGEGTWVAEWRRLGIDAVGIDVVDRFCQSSPHVLPCAGDGTIPFADGSFQTVTLINASQHMLEETVASYYREALRVTRPGGLLYATVFDPGALSQVARLRSGDPGVVRHHGIDISYITPWRHLLHLTAVGWTVLTIGAHQAELLGILARRWPTDKTGPEVPIQD